MKKFNGAPHSFCYQQWCIKTKKHIYHYESKEEELLWGFYCEGANRKVQISLKHSSRDTVMIKIHPRWRRREGSACETRLRAKLQREFHFLFKEKLPVHIQRHWRQFCLWWTDIYILTLTTNEEASEAVKTGSSRSSVSNRYCYFIHFYYWIVTYLFIYLLGKKKHLKQTYQSVWELIVAS